MQSDAGTPRITSERISCPVCSYDLAGHVLPCVCPECGIEITLNLIEQNRRRARYHRHAWLWIVINLVLGSIAIAITLMFIEDHRLWSKPVNLAVSGVLGVLPVALGLIVAPFVRVTPQWVPIVFWLKLCPILYAGWLASSLLITMGSWFPGEDLGGICVFGLIAFALPIVTLMLWIAAHLREIDRAGLPTRNGAYAAFVMIAVSFSIMSLLWSMLNYLSAFSDV